MWKNAVLVGPAEQHRISRRCVELLGKAQQAGAIDAGVDLEWARRVYYALIGETLAGADAAADPDALAGRVVDTLLHGIGPRAAHDHVSSAG